jgi:hypothetical protein
MSNIRFVNSNIVDRYLNLSVVSWKQCSEDTYLDASQGTTVAFILGITCDIYPCICSFLSLRNARLWLIYLSVLLAIFLGTIGLSVGYKIYDLEKTPMPFSLLHHPTPESARRQ